MRPDDLSAWALRILRLGFAALALTAIVVQLFSYTFARGAITGWYPYPFIDPGIHSAGGLIVNCDRQRAHASSSSRLSTLPVALRGSSSRKTISRGTL